MCAALALGDTSAHAPLARVSGSLSVSGFIHVMGNADAVLVYSNETGDTIRFVDDGLHEIPGCTRYQETDEEAEMGRANIEFGLDKAALGNYTLWVSSKREAELLDTTWGRDLGSNRACEGDAWRSALRVGGWYRIIFKFSSISSSDTCGVWHGALVRAKRPVPWR